METNQQNGTLQAPKQEEKAGKTEQIDQVGPFLDRPKDLWKVKKSPSGKAYKTEKKLEKDKDKGIRKMEKEIQESIMNHLKANSHVAGVLEGMVKKEGSKTLTQFH